MLSRFAYLLLLITPFCVACDDTVKKGYWWYCETPSDQTEEESEPARTLLGPPPPPRDMMGMHPDDLSEMREAYLKQAIWTGKPQHVLEYYKVLDSIRKKSLMFTSLSDLVLLKNPDLYAYGQYQKTNSGRKDVTRARMDQVSDSLSRYKNDYGIFMFSRSDCMFCRTQSSILSSFSEKHGWKVKHVDIERNPIIAERFEIRYVPVTVIVKKGEDNWMPIAVGEEALTTIEANAYRAIRYLNGHTTPGQFLQMSYDDGTGLDPDSVPGELK